MDKGTYTELLRKPKLVTKSQTENLKAVVDAFPYFQSAGALYLKGLKNTESFKYNQALKTTAAYTTDRSILFDFITSENFQQNEISQHIKQNTTQTTDIKVYSKDLPTTKSVTIDAILKQHLEDSKKTLDPELFQPKIKIKEVANFELDPSQELEDKTGISKGHLQSAEQVLNLGKPLNFDKAETHSFNEWLSLTHFKPINRELEKEENTSEECIDDNKSNTLTQAKKFALIEKFIEKNPKLEAKKTSASKHNIAKAQMIQPEALMTETLARIYVEQKNYTKAIQSYKILILKYPRKKWFLCRPN
ncbi:hypothetical protein N7U66_16590 [Lacinutrix neustonica]|uniref:Tetratricopeptide repeat protein n=1 Tax=Lacinutrix neustonica TaxID=2980107 RepID=A0A9E8MWH2_9FLAO|nr:hypothetical protein [Lacinutrix neustonica]WAC01560.1 hypothetical protein N7U66_16590 [Lacinutrix neustonica]